MKFKTTMLKSSFCDYSDAFTLVKVTKIVPNTAGAATVAAASNGNKKVIIKNCAPFTDCTNRRSDK